MNKETKETFSDPTYLKIDLIQRNLSWGECKKFQITNLDANYTI